LSPESSISVTISSALFKGAGSLLFETQSAWNGTKHRISRAEKVEGIYAQAWESLLRERRP
jgi:hypothetical protein